MQVNDKVVKNKQFLKCKTRLYLVISQIQATDMYQLCIFTVQFNYVSEINTIHLLNITLYYYTVQKAFKTGYISSSAY